MSVVQTDDDPRREAINVTDKVVEFDIDVAAGVQPTRHKVQPGDTVLLSPGYCEERGGDAGRELIPSIIERLTRGAVVPLESVKGRDFVARQRGAR